MNDRALKSKVVGWFESMGMSVDEIPESDEKTADLCLQDEQETYYVGKRPVKYTFLCRS